MTRFAAAVVLVLAAFSAPAQKPADVLVLRGGQVVAGQLASCDADGCKLGDKTYARAEIGWIGLGVADSAPPMVTYNSEDEVHLRDGSVFRGHLGSVSAERVEIEGGSYARARVTWLHLIKPKKSS